MPGLYDQLDLNNKQLPLDEAEVQAEKDRIKMRNRLAGIQPSDEELDRAAREAVAKKATQQPVPDEMSVDLSNKPKAAPQEQEPSKPVDEESAAPEEAPKPAPAANKMPAPDVFKTNVTSLKNRQAKLDAVSDKLPPDKQAIYKDKLATLDKAIKDSEDRYEEREDRINWAQAADIIGQAVTQMAAGYYGLQHGYDMTGVKFSKIDWEKKLDRLFDRYDKDVNRYTKQKESTESEQGAEERARIKTGQEERQSLRGQFEKEDSNQVRLKELQATLADKDARGEDTLRTKMEIAKLQDSMKSRGLEEKAQQNKSRETMALGKDLENIEKNKSVDSRIKQKESLLSRLGATPEEIQKIKGGDDKLFTFDSERDSRLSKAINSKIQDKSSNQAVANNPKPAEATSNVTPPASNPTAGGKIRVKKIATGEVGTIDSQDFDANVYQKVQ